MVLVPNITSRHRTHTTRAFASLSGPGSPKQLALGALYMASPSQKMPLQNSSKKGAGLQTGRVAIGHGNGSNPAVYALLLPFADTCHTHESISISRMRQYSSSGWIALLCLPQAVDCNSASDQFKDITRGSIFHHEKYIIGSYRRSSCTD